MGMGQLNIRQWILFAVALFLLIHKTPSEASHPNPCTSCPDPVEGILNANSLIAFDAPLPMTRYERGNWQVAVKPTYLKVNELFHRRGGIHKGEDMKGWGGSAALSYALTDRWLVYGILTGAQLSGKSSGKDVSSPFMPSNWTADDIPNYQNQIEGTVSVYNLNSGIGFNMIGNSAGRWSIPLFLGFFVQQVKADLKAGAASTIDLTYYPNGLPPVDYTGNNTQPGASVGLAAACNVTKRIQVTPYFMAAKVFSKSKFKQTVTGVHPADAPPPSWPVGYTDESQLRHGAQETLFPIFGLNLTYRPWGLAFGLGGLIPLLSPEDSYDGLKLTKFSITYAFGHYVK